jgi:hypothetical protein
MSNRRRRKVRLAESATLPAQLASDCVATGGDCGDPVTLHRVIQLAIGQGLKERYEISREMPHALLVLLMQMNEERRQKPKTVRAS